MKNSLVARAVGGACLIVAPLAAASAQVWVPGSEITGQSIQVETNGIVNTVYFDPGGVARIATPAGTEVQGRWSVADQMLCLENGAARECWPYQSAFMAGQPVTLTSSCDSTSRWVANAVNPPAQPAPQPAPSGERG
jgi:hypothetical protein